MRALIIDNGEYTFLAERLGREIEVGYYSPWSNSLPLAKSLWRGQGLPGVTRVNEPLRELNERKVDLVIVPDLHHTDMERLARSVGIPTWGSGDGCRLENDRWFLKEFLDAKGLNVVPSVQIKGIDNLADYLEDPANQDKWVKLSVLRGETNTFHHCEWPETSIWLADLRVRLGPIGTEILFIVEDDIPEAVEISIEGYAIDGLILPFMVGLEIKDAGEFGFYCDDIDRLPKNVQKVLLVIADYFAECKYRNWFALELRITPDGEVYLIDVACRIPVPPGAALIGSTHNLTEVLMKGAEGHAIHPDIGDARYLCEIELKSKWVVSDFLNVRYPDDVADSIALFSHCRIDGENWIIPHLPPDPEADAFASVCAYGPKMEKVAEECAAVAEQVKAFQMTYNSDVLEKAQEELAKAAQLGIGV